LLPPNEHDSPPTKDDAMDIVLLSGFALVGTMLAAMAGLIHTEARYARRALHYRPPHQPRPRGRARPAGAETRRHGAGWSGAGAGRTQANAHDYCRAHAAPAATPVQPAHSNPWAPFVVGPAADHDDLKRQYRALARTHHPDCGGDLHTMARINLLYSELEAVCKAENVLVSG